MTEHGSSRTFYGWRIVGAAFVLAVFRTSSSPLSSARCRTRAAQEGCLSAPGTASGLLSVERQGRHRYHRLATPAVAHMLESIMQVASDLEPSRKPLAVGPR